VDSSIVAFQFLDDRLYLSDRALQLQVGRRAGVAAMDIVNYDVRLRDNYDGRSTGVIVAVNWL